MCVYKMLTIKGQKSAFNHLGNMSGIKHVSTSRGFSLADIKTATKKHGVSINDYMTTILSISAKHYLKMHK